MKPVITFFDAFEADKNFFESHLREQFDLIFVDKGLSADTVDQAAKAQIIAMHVTSPTTAELMAKMPDLKHIACRSTGYDHVDLRYAADHDITVSSVPSYGDQTVAEFAVMLLLSVSRRLMPSVEATDRSMLLEMITKTIGSIISPSSIKSDEARMRLAVCRK